MHVGRVAFALGVGGWAGGEEEAVAIDRPSAADVVPTRLPNLHVKSCEFCVYKCVASHLSRPKKYAISAQMSPNIPPTKDSVVPTASAFF